MGESNAICLACGLCCNGVIFADVKLQPEDDATGLRALGLPLRPARQEGVWKWPQPCAALEGCRCRIYRERPRYCREFDCALLRQVQRETVTPAAALQTIQVARERAEKVRGLLRRLGDDDEDRALAGRFRRVARRMEAHTMDEATAEAFSQLTLAVHDLNLLISKAFYPGEQCGEA